MGKGVAADRYPIAVFGSVQRYGQIGRIGISLAVANPAEVFRKEGRDAPFDSVGFSYVKIGKVCAHVVTPYVFICVFVIGRD